MSRYDTTFIINPQIGDEGIESSIKRVTELITGGKGQILRENRIGSRKLAYQIGKSQHGYYVSFVFDGDGAIVKKLDNHFKLDDTCLRHLTIRYDGDPHRQSLSERFTFETRRRSEVDDGGDESDVRGRNRSRSFVRVERTNERGAGGDSAPSSGASN